MAYSHVPSAGGVRLHGADRKRHLTDCTFAGFEIDGSGVASAEYNPLAKGLGLQNVVRGVFGNLSVRGNRIWDSRQPPAQTHGLWITEQGSCVDCRVEDNDLAGNAEGPTRLDTPPIGGRWERNHGDDDWDRPGR